MAVVTFDTLKFVKTLEAAGLPPQQAEAISAAVRDSHETAELVTKADLREYESTIRRDLDKLDATLRQEVGNVRHEIADVRHEITDVRHEIKQLEQRMTIKLGSMLVVAVGVIAAIIKLL